MIFLIFSWVPCTIINCFEVGKGFSHIAWVSYLRLMIEWVTQIWFSLILLLFHYYYIPIGKITSIVFQLHRFKKCIFFLHYLQHTQKLYSVIRLPSLILNAQKKIYVSTKVYSDTSTYNLTNFSQIKSNFLLCLEVFLYFL